MFHTLPDFARTILNGVYRRTGLVIICGDSEIQICPVQPILELAKTRRFINNSLNIEDVVVRLVELGYLCLSDSDFKSVDDTYDTMRRFGGKCMYSHLKKCHQCHLECVAAFNPSGKYYLELDFDYSGNIHIESSKMTIGKSTYTGEKAIDLANKFIFKDPSE